MTDKFRVPTPSEAAVGAAARSFGQDPSCGIPPTVFLWDAIRCANAVDVPGIVRSEVERFVQFLIAHPKSFDSGCALLDRLAEYKARRFGEGEPEKWSTKHEHQWTTLGGGNPAVLCGACGAFKDQAPSAPAVRIDGVLHDTNLRNTCVRCTWTPDGSLAGRCERCGQSQAVDDSENDRLAKLEAFCAVWAKWQTLQATTEEMRVAAREYLR